MLASDSCPTEQELRSTEGKTEWSGPDSAWLVGLGLLLLACWLGQWPSARGQDSCSINSLYSAHIKCMAGRDQLLQLFAMRTCFSPPTAVCSTRQGFCRTRHTALLHGTLHSRDCWYAPETLLLTLSVGEKDGPEEPQQPHLVTIFPCRDAGERTAPMSADHHPWTEFMRTLLQQQTRPQASRVQHSPFQWSSRKLLGSPPVRRKTKRSKTSLP